MRFDAGDLRTLVTAFDVAPIGLVVSTRDGRWEFVNAAFGRLLAEAPEDLVGRTVLDFVHPDDVEAAVSAMRALEGGEEHVVVTIRFVRRDGTIAYARATASVVADAETGRSHRVTVVEDRAAELAAAERRRRDARRTQALLDGTGALIFVKDTDLVYRQVNAAFARMAGRSIEECVGRTDFELFAPEIAAIYRSNDEALLASGERQDREVPVDDAVRGRRIFNAAKFPLRDGDRIWGIGCVGHDVTDQVRLRDDLESSAQTVRQEARTDPVTGLANRRMIVETAQLLLAPDGTGTTIVFCDLDGFKAVNDRHGHDAGDALLAAVGARLRSAVRPGDVVGRWGGDEFVLLRPGIADAAAQERLRQRVRAAIAAVSTPDGDPAAGSVGTAVGLPGDDLDDALAAADAAMYVAKRGRRAAC